MFRWRADVGPTLNVGLVALWFFRGSGPVLLRNPIFLWFSGGGGGPHMYAFKKRIFKKRLDPHFMIDNMHITRIKRWGGGGSGRPWNITNVSIVFLRNTGPDPWKITKLPNRNCLGKFREIPWNQTTDVHRGSTLISRVITWRWRYRTWRWRHRNHVNTIASVIAAKQTAWKKLMLLFCFF